MEKTHALLKEHFGWDEKRSDVWLDTPQKSLGEITPRRYIEMNGEERFENWLTHKEYLRGEVSVDHKEQIKADTEKPSILKKVRDAFSK